MKIYTYITYILYICTYTYIHHHITCVCVYILTQTHTHTHTHILRVVDLDPEGLTERLARTLASRTVPTLPRRYPQRVPR
jgi:hypothetical protein